MGEGNLRKKGGWGRGNKGDLERLRGNGEGRERGLRDKGGMGEEGKQVGGLRRKRNGRGG